MTGPHKVVVVGAGIGANMSALTALLLIGLR
jgi:hypothetical protein